VRHDSLTKYHNYSQIDFSDTLHEISLLYTIGSSGNQQLCVQDKWCSA